MPYVWPICQYVLLRTRIDGFYEEASNNFFQPCPPTRWLMVAPLSGAKSNVFAYFFVAYYYSAFWESLYFLRLLSYPRYNFNAFSLLLLRYPPSQTINYDRPLIIHQININRNWMLMMLTTCKHIFSIELNQHYLSELDHLTWTLAKTTLPGLFFVCWGRDYFLVNPEWPSRLAMIDQWHCWPVKILDKGTPTIFYGWQVLWWARIRSDWFRQGKKLTI